VAVHIYTQTIHRTTQITTNVEECGPCLVFASFTLAFALKLRKKHGKTSVRLRITSVRVQYTYYQNTHTLQNTHTHTHTHTLQNAHIHPHTLQNNIKPPQYKLKQTQCEIYPNEIVINPNEIVIILHKLYSNTAKDNHKTKSGQGMKENRLTQRHMPSNSFQSACLMSLVFSLHSISLGISCVY